MCSRCPERSHRSDRVARLARSASAIALFIATSPASIAADGERELRVCADPDNLPYSHIAETGFENRIARLVADELHAKLSYEWLPQIRGYVRKTMGAGLCDVFIGVPAGFERVSATRPYYRSTYVIVERAAASALPVRSFDDPRLTRMRLGVQLVGNDLATTPPGHALAAHGAIDNVTGFTPMGDRPSAERMIGAIVAGDLDAALLWGPQAGYFARRASVPLRIAPLAAPPDLGGIPFEYAIAMGVKRGNAALRDELDAILVRRKADIDAILEAYDVPRTDSR